MPGGKAPSRPLTPLRPNDEPPNCLLSLDRLRARKAPRARRASVLRRWLERAGVAGECIPGRASRRTLPLRHGPDRPRRGQRLLPALAPLLSARALRTPAGRRGRLAVAASWHRPDCAAVGRAVASSYRSRRRRRFVRRGRPAGVADGVGAGEWSPWPATRLPASALAGQG